MNNLDEWAEGTEDRPETEGTQGEDVAPEVSEEMEESPPEPEASADTKELPELEMEEAEPEQAEEAAIIDLNTATEADLQALPGIGPALVLKIINVLDPFIQLLLQRVELDLKRAHGFVETLHLGSGQGNLFFIAVRFIDFS